MAHRTGHGGCQEVVATGEGLSSSKSTPSKDTRWLSSELPFFADMVLPNLLGQTLTGLEQPQEPDSLGRRVFTPDDFDTMPT